MAPYGRLSTLGSGNAPFPTRQMAILALCRICEPIAFMSIFPYAYFMVEDFSVGKGKAEIAMYTGMVTSSFAFMECISGIFWGRLSDRIGRKKVLLGGLFGTGLSMLLFGFARSLPMALVARALGGLLNGNIGVLQTTVAELVTDEKHQPRAYSIMPFVWCLGTIIGATLGGVLARPAKAWTPFVGTIFETYPYLLPNLVCAAVVVFGLAVGILFLEETHEDRKFDRDSGCAAGQWLLRKVWKRDVPATFSDKDALLDEMRSMLADHDSKPQGFQSNNSSPTLCSTRTSISEPPSFFLDKEAPQAPTLRQAFSKQVCLNIVCYGILAFHTISLEQLLPIMMSKQVPKHEAQQLPFYFSGGFGWTTQKTGGFLAMQGALQMIAQVFLFPYLSKKLGSLRTFWITLSLYPLLYILAPYLALLPTNLRTPGLMVLLVAKVTFQSLSYPSLAIILANSSPSKRVLGTLNGAAASAASISRGFGPTISGAMDSWGEHIGMSGLAWWTIAGVAFLGWAPGFFLQEGNKRSIYARIPEDEESLADSMSDTASIITLTADEPVETVLSK
ncbi:MFS general substrate transporter [Dothidotthia symphoricarpi CBS 119687]|uniref:MFS general substrate transporter n=1 Tax=Dothidotthia symphoricarpi CBS 119687 TaxID=1392245 RepID=A0A6A6AI95_9PLEO|nr:MFS general substrate transporter [Dothidotthia symphoricarpi CBS 119687]KAF2130627.1 MFS general substrate transporter [Dothidotthia symphoricarpi CBS 119687]